MEQNGKAVLSDIVGTETEFGLWPAVYIDKLGDYLDDDYLGYFEYLPDGGRLYKDIEVPEYSTVETDLKHLVPTERHGERLVTLAVRRLFKDKPHYKLQFLTLRTNDGKGARSGAHVNHLIGSEIALHARKHWRRDFVAEMATLYAARPVFAGAGMLTADGEWRTSQRFTGPNILAGDEMTAKEKPVFGSRDEPWADRSRLARLHDVAGDRLVFAYPREWGVGFTASALAFRRLGGSWPDLCPVPDNIPQAAENWSINPDFRQPLGDGRRLSSVDFIEELNTRILERHGREPFLNDQQQVVMAHSVGLVDQYRKDRTELTGKVQWVAKQAIYGGLARRHGKPLRDKAVLQAEVKFDPLLMRNGAGDIVPGIGQTLPEKDYSMFHTPDALEALTEAAHTPLVDNRGRLRAELLRRNRGRLPLMNVNWQMVRENNDDYREGGKHLMLDPRLSEDVCT